MQVNITENITDDLRLCFRFAFTAPLRCLPGNLCPSLRRHALGPRRAALASERLRRPLQHRRLRNLAHGCRRPSFSYLLANCQDLKATYMIAMPPTTMPTSGGP